MAATDPHADPVVRALGRQDYGACLQAMMDFTAARDERSADEIWLVEHAPVYTLGQAGRPENLLAADTGIPLVRVDRGGQITYHGPGQVVAYLLIDLRRRGLFVRDFVWRIEQAVIDTLASYGIAGERHPGAPGIYLAEGRERGAKIAALGLKIRNGRSYHGVALNVAMDLAPFGSIHPCGQPGLATTDMLRLGAVAGVESMPEAGRRLAAALTASLTTPPNTPTAAPTPRDPDPATATPARADAAPHEDTP